MIIAWAEGQSIHVGTTDCGLQFVIRKWAGSDSYTVTVATDSGRILEWNTGFGSVDQAKEFAAGKANEVAA